MYFKKLLETQDKRCFRYVTEKTHTDQMSGYSIGNLIKRAQQGIPINGDKSMGFDGVITKGGCYSEEVNPFSRMDFDLDSAIELAKQNKTTIEGLQKSLAEQKEKLNKGNVPPTGEKPAESGE